MAAQYTDKPRLLTLKADGKSDLLLPRRFTASERMSGLFKVEIEALVVPDKVSQIQLDQLLGKRMNLRVSFGADYSKGPYRYFDGICSRIASRGKDKEFSYFQVELVPWLWLLTKRSDFRIYQDLSVPDLVEKVLKELQQDFSEFKFDIRVNRGNYKKIDYCTQFRETHFNFVSRLLEQEGIYYYFEHTESGHKMIIDDSLTAGKDVPNEAEVQYFPMSSADEMVDETIYDWREERVIHSGKFAARDYHSQIAQNKIDYSGIKSNTVVGGNDKLEIFEWPSGSSLRYNQTDKRLDEVNSQGSTLINLRAQASETTHHSFYAKSSCRGFTPGYRFNIKGESGKKYLLTEVQHVADQNPNYVTDSSKHTPYQNTCDCIPGDVQFRPQQETEKPLVEGMQTAKVVGKDGDEIYVDKYGRVRVQFYWDRKGENNEKSTCWVRVAQISAGKRWGASFWPRVGQEVVVAFVEGDPDQPMIVGSLYNNQQMPPYLGDGLDDKHKNDPNVSGIKSNSTKGGEGFNEWRFDDTKGKEQVFIHAEKDMDVRVKDETREHTVGDRFIIVGDKDNDKSGNFIQNVWQKYKLQTLKDKHERVEGNAALTIGHGDNPDGGNLDHWVEKDSRSYVGGDHHLTVNGAYNQSIKGNTSLQTAQWDAKTDQSISFEATQSIHLKAMTIVLEADMQLSLKVGGNFVDVSVAGVAINGMPMTLINSGGAAGVGVPANPMPATEASPIEKPDDSVFHRADDSKSGSKSCS